MKTFLRRSHQQEVQRTPRTRRLWAKGLVVPSKEAAGEPGLVVATDPTADRKHNGVRPHYAAPLRQLVV